MRRNITGRPIPTGSLARLALISAALAFQALPALSVGENEADKPVPRSAETVEAAKPAAAPAPVAAEPEKAAAPRKAAEDQADEPATTKKLPAYSQPSYSGRLRLQYDYREQGDATDSDFYGYLYGNMRNLHGGRVDLYTSARMKSDLDDTSSSSLADDPFRSLDESDGVTENRVLQLYADIHDRSRNLALRGGRQYIEIADYLHLDGAQLQVRENRELGGRIYGGRPVSYYSSVSDDYAGGVSFVGRPWEGNRSRLTLARYHDGEQDEDDQNYYLDVRQNFTDASRARGQLSVLNDEFRMGRLDWFYTAPDGTTDFSLGGSYWGSFDAKTRVYSPLYNVLGEQDPYTYSYARLTQQIVPKWMVSPGVSFRFAESEESSGGSNRDYENYELALIYEPSRAFNASVALEYWSVEESDSFLGVSGELRYRHARLWEVSGGASFAEYTYDTFSDISYTAGGGQAVFSESGTVIEESPFVRTYFVRGKWNVTKHLALRAQFDVEDDDSEDDLAYRARGSVEVRL